MTLQFRKERLLCAHNATSSAHLLITSRTTFGHIQHAHKLWAWPMLSPARENLFDCPQCDYFCKKTKTIKSPLLTQLWEKPFICTQCKYSCTRAGNHKRRMLPIEEKNSWVAPNLIIPALTPFTSKHTCQPYHEKTSHLHTVRVFLHKSWKPQDTPSNTLRRETICLHTLQLLLHSTWVKLVSLRGPCNSHARGRKENILAAHCAPKPAQKLVTFNNPWSDIWPSGEEHF